MTTNLHFRSLTPGAWELIHIMAHWIPTVRVHIAGSPVFVARRKAAA